MTDQALENRRQWARYIGEMEAKLSNLENEVRKSDDKLAGAKRNRTYGIGAIVFAVLGLLFFSPGYLGFLWLFLIPVGILTLITAVIRQSGANSERIQLQSDITMVRGKLAESRAMLPG